MGIPYSLFGYSVNLKRIWKSSTDASASADDDDEVQPPVRKKLKTADYIYEHLFVGGEGSDILIKARSCEWKLHRVYLAQSPYFASMFSGKWRETNFREVSVEFPDWQITADSLTIVLGSLYKDSIDIDLAKAVSLVATAVALQLENVVQQCAEVMVNNIGIKSVHSYFNASLDYGLQDVEKQCRQWLARNLLHFSGNASFLRKISPSLMADLVKSPGLYVIQGEMDLYWLLKKWTYVRSCPLAKDAQTDLKTAMEEYFSSYGNGNASFLASSKGQAFVSVFSDLRLHHILSASKSYQTLCDDNIIPKDVIDRIMAAQWRRQLAMDSENETGDENATFDEEAFDQRAIRCGRVLPNDNAFCWRWSGYFFGVDILLNYKNRLLSMKRNCGSQPAPYSVNMKGKRKICYKLSIVKFNEKRQETWCLSTGFKWATLEMEQTAVLARIPSGIQFPLTIIYSFVTVPFVDDFAADALAAAWGRYLSPPVSAYQAEEEFEEEDFAFSQDDESEEAASG